MKSRVNISILLLLAAYQLSIFADHWKNSDDPEESSEYREISGCINCDRTYIPQITKIPQIDSRAQFELSPHTHYGMLDVDAGSRMFFY